MPLFEYSEFDGSQEFQPLSAEALFDRVAEYLLEHGDYVLRHLEKLDRDDADLLKKLIKEGYLEKDEQGRLTVRRAVCAGFRTRPSMSCSPSPAKTPSANTPPISREPGRCGMRTANRMSSAIRWPTSICTRR